MLDRSRTLFDLTPVAPFLVKGKTKPVTAFEVGEARGVRSEVATDDVPLVGRAHELEVFDDACSAAREGSGTYLRLVADAGAGKSRLLRELESRVGAMRFRRACCRLYQSATPYFPFTQLLPDLLSLSGSRSEDDLRRVVDEHRPDLAPWLSLIGVACGVAIEPSPEVLSLGAEFRREQLESAVVALLGSVLTDPVVLCLEDAQWMDEASCELLGALVAEVGTRPWVVLLAQRPDPGGPTDQLRPADDLLRLHPLSPAQLGELVAAATTAAPLPERRVAALVERSGGNPMFLLELLHAVEAGSDTDALPTSIEGLLTARIDRLPSAERTLLRHLSVLGTGFRRSYAEQVAPTGSSVGDDAFARLSEFLRSEDGWVRFRHDLVRDVAYEGLPYRARRDLHERVAESILAGVAADHDDLDAVAPLLSLHFHEAGRPEEAWRYSTLAGARAKAIYANADAATLYRRALQAAVQIDAEVRLRALAWESLGDVEELNGSLAEARRAYVAARLLPVDDPVLEARMLLKTSFIDERLGHFTTAVRSIRRGLRILEPVDDSGDELRAELWGALAAIRIRQGRFAQGANAGSEAVRLAERLGDSSTLARALMTLDFARSRLEEDLDHAGTRRALAISTALGDLSGEAAAANLLGAYAYFAGHWDEAVGLYRRSRLARERTGDPGGVATANANLAEVLLEQGALEEADALLASASSVWRASDDEWSVAFADRLRGVARCRAGAFAEAGTLLTGARDAFVALGASADVVETDVAIAELFAVSGRAEEAVALLDAVIAGDPAAAGLEHLLPPSHRLRGTARASLWAEGAVADIEHALAIRALGLVQTRGGGSVDSALAAEGAAIEARLGLRPRLEPTPSAEGDLGVRVQLHEVLEPAVALVADRDAGDRLGDAEPVADPGDEQAVVALRDDPGVVEVDRGLETVGE